VAAGKSGEGEGGGLPRLPPGRHGLPREFVAENQRRRIAAAMIQVVVDRGYAAATVTQVVAAAGVSRRTFYNYYADKAEAFFDVYAQVTDFLLETMAAAGAAGRSAWPVRVRSRLQALLDSFAANPDLLVFALRVPPTAGGEVAAEYRAFLERLLDVIVADRPKKARRPPPAAEYALIGGLVALIDGAEKDGGPAAISALDPEVAELVLAPYLGREAAARVAR
jgi:AcrR family transcriptional regulator